MKIEGGCYCGEVRWKVDGEPKASLNCHCRECQYGSGGHPAALMTVHKGEFEFTKGEAKWFTRSDLKNPITRYFCGNCGTGIVSRSPLLPETIFLKVGTFDDPSIFKPAAAIFTVDKQQFHHIPEDMTDFKGMPG